MGGSQAAAGMPVSNSRADESSSVVSIQSRCEAGAAVGDECENEVGCRRRCFCFLGNSVEIRDRWRYLLSLN